MIPLADLDVELARRALKALEEPEPPVVRLATRLEPRFRDGFIQAFEALRGAVDVDALAEALLSGRMTTPALDAALARLPQELRDAWRPLLQRAFLVGAADALATLSMDFALVNPLAVEWAARRSAQLVTEIDAATRARIQALTAEAIAGRADVRQTARLLRDVVGLRTDQVETLARRIAEWRAAGIEGDLLDARSRRLSQAMLRQRAILIARTEILSAANAGQQEAWRVATKQGLLDPKAWRRRWIATHDDRLEPICFELDGTTAPLVGGEFPGGYAAPPAHPNCLPGETLVAPAGTITAQTERWYEGELVVILTASGDQLACTPNHPILTALGWRPARMLHEGDEVVHHLSGQRVSAAEHHDVHVPTRIEEIARTLRHAGQMAATEVPVTAEDFHGDGVGSQIAVVRADGLLWDRGQSAHGKLSGNATLQYGRSRSVLTGSRDQDTVLSYMAGPTRGHVRGAGLAASLIRAHSRPLRAFSRAAPEDRHVMVTQGPSDGAAADAKLAAQAQERHLPRGVAFDPVVRIGRRPFTGHVYNLETTAGWYIAGGIITHNCRCSMRLVQAKA